MRVGCFYAGEILQGVTAPEARNRLRLRDIRHFQEHPSKTIKFYFVNASRMKFDKFYTTLVQYRIPDHITSQIFASHILLA